MTWKILQESGDAILAENNDFLVTEDDSPQGPRNGTTWASDSTVGNVAWSDAGRAETQDDTYAICTLSGIVAGQDPSEYLKGTNFGFTIPLTATIEGILVEAEKSIDSGGGDVATVDYSARLVKAGSVVGNDYANATEWSSDDDIYETYGGATDLWGTTWTPAEINSSGFGFALAGTINSAFATVDIRVDHVRITVYYTEAGSATVTTSTRMAMMGIGN